MDKSLFNPVKLGLFMIQSHVEHTVSARPSQVSFYMYDATSMLMSTREYIDEIGPAALKVIENSDTATIKELREVADRIFIKYLRAIKGVDEDEAKDMCEKWCKHLAGLGVVDG